MSDELAGWEDEMRKWVSPTSDVLKIYDAVNKLIVAVVGARPLTKFVRADGNLAFKIGTMKLGTFEYDKSAAWFWNRITKRSDKTYGEMYTLEDFQKRRPTFEQSIKEMLEESAEDDEEDGFTEAAERDVERALAADLSQLEPGLKLYDGSKGEQFEIADKRIDLLCVDSNGKLVVIEIKRGLPNREAIGQAAEYKSLVAEQLAKGDLDMVRVILLGEQRNSKDDKNLERAAKAVGIETK